MSSIVSANDSNGSGFSWSWLYWLWKVLLHILLTCFDTSIHSKIVQYGHVNKRHFDLVWTNKSKRVIGWSGHISWNNIPEALWNQNNFLSFLESKPVWQLLLPSFFRDENLSMLNFSSHFFLSNFWRLELFFFSPLVSISSCFVGAPTFAQVTSFCFFDVVIEAISCDI